MTVRLDIANRALQLVGTRTNMSTAEFNNQTSNEAIQSQLIMDQLRDELNRMAPWDCARKFANLTYITSLPTTPENPTSGPPLWQPGIPAPPWAYEYQYPVDCVRAIKIIPQYTAQAGGVPIYPPGTVTGAITPGWTGPAIKFIVATDSFISVIDPVTIVAPGTGYAFGDIITLPQPSFNMVQAGITYPMPVGAPLRLSVTAIGGGGAITGISVVEQVYQHSNGGSYFSAPTGTLAQASTTGNGIGATFSIPTSSLTTGPQRVILCNQQQPILQYNTRIDVTDVLDQLFQDAWIHILGARLSFQLNGDKLRANELIMLTNNMITEARKADGNEGLTVNDVTPDFIRTRGNFGGPAWEYSPNMSFDWGSYYSPY